MTPPERFEPQAFVVEVGPDRLHFLDWTAGAPPNAPAILLLHGLASTAWSWAPVARRLAGPARVVAMDLRGHGLSDAPTSGYEPATLAEDALAVLEGSGLLDGMGPLDGSGRLVLAGHGFGTCVAAWTAPLLGDRLTGLVLVDGGIEDVAGSSGMTPDEWLRGVGDPPEVLRSMSAFLADRRGYDPASWDADQERAARSTVVAVPAGHLVPAIHPHALEASVRAMFEYRPREALTAFEAPVTALLAGEDTPERAEALGELQLSRDRAGLPRIGVSREPAAGHNLMRYRPDAVTAAILEAAGVRR